MSAKPKAGPYARVYGPWLERVAAARPGTTQLIVMLCLCERLEFDAHGNASAWYPRAEMAERLGLKEAAIRDALSGLKEKGLVSVRRTGHNGRATVYNVFPGTPWPDARSNKGCPPANPTEHGTTHPGRVGLAAGGLKGWPPANPLRHKEGCAGLTALRPLGLDISPYEEW